MTRFNGKILIIGFMLTTGIFMTSCKSKTADTNTTADTTAAMAPAPVSPAPVEIAADDSLTTGVKDATKDYPKVNATVSSGEITLTGEIERNKLPNLMQSLNTLKPKKINNNLTIK